MVARASHLIGAAEYRLLLSGKGGCPARLEDFFPVIIPCGQSWPRFDQCN